MGRMTRTLRALVAVALVAAAFAVARTEPPEEVAFAPFVVRVEVGDVGEGRGLQGAVDGALLADEVTLDDWTGDTTGVWLVVHTRMATTENPSLAYATLDVGERRWTASTRPGLRAMNSAGLDAGLPMAGSFAFELPADVADQAAARSATLRLAAEGDPRLRTVIETELDLTELAHEGVFEIAPKERIRW